MNIKDELINLDSVAIIGMSCRFPGAENIHRFWENLQQGRESITTFSKEELKASKVPYNLYNSENYVNRACIIDNIELFDASFFGYSVEDAELIDPQQRLLMECAYEAFEDAGYALQNLNSVVGLFGGVRGGGYAKILEPVLSQVGTLKYFKALLGTTVDQACMRTAYTLDLRGPSIGVQTVCSTSLVAVHLACESLKNGECDMALAGASSLSIPQKQGYLYDERMVTSPDGHCRAFDIHSKGAMGGNGVGVILLKRFEQAYADHDNIYAIIRGSAVNNDGARKAGYRVPAVEGQVQVIREALQMAEIDPETVDYIEANGTGTLIGDMIETEALKRALEKQPGKTKSCKIGSVKTNIGHLIQAAGMAGLIKTVLSLKNKQFPPSLNCKTPIPNLNAACLQVNTQLCDWERKDYPRRAGVSAFAIGGTNAHLILQEAREENDDGHQGASSGRHHVFTISAKSKTALQNLIEKYLKFLEENSHASIEAICHTSNVGRNHYPHRAAVVVDSNAGLHEKLSEELEKRTNTETDLNINENKKRVSICFAFPGNPLQTANRIEEMYNEFDFFRTIINRCDLFVQEMYHFSILPTLLRKGFDDSSHQKCCAIFALEYALAELLMSWNINPLMVAGNKTGAYVAACVAGVFSYEDAVKLIVSNAMADKQADKTLNVLGNMELNAPAIKLLLFDQEEKLTEAQILNPSCWINKIILEKEMDSRIFNACQEEEINCLIDAGGTVYHQSGGETSPFFPELKDRLSYNGMLKSMAWLYCNGEDVNWNAFHMGGKCQRIPLPTYPFERVRCWFDG